MTEGDRETEKQKKRERESERDRRYTCQVRVRTKRRCMQREASPTVDRKGMRGEHRVGNTRREGQDAKEMSQS